MISKKYKFSKVKYSILFTCLLIITLCLQAQNSGTPQLGQNSIQDVIKAMTLEEKAKLVVGKGFSLPGVNMGQTDETPDKITGISGHTVPISRLGIPSMGFAEGPA